VVVVDGTEAVIQPIETLGLTRFSDAIALGFQFSNPRASPMGLYRGIWGFLSCEKPTGDLRDG
jgi:hypothetical protein